MATDRRFSAGSKALLCLLVAALTICAAPRAATAADGRDLVANGNSNGAPPCSACHGEHGEGRPDAGYPRLAGIDAKYLLQQLNDFADKNRDNEIMRPIATSLTPDERTTVTSFYAALNPPIAPEAKASDKKDIAAGEKIALRGEWPKGLPACGQCHGPLGQGVGLFPRLAGQNAAYIASQLNAWKDGQRGNDPMHLMTGVVAKLDKKEIAALAAYYSSLSPAGQQGKTP
jgi:cytochrome c553